MTSKGPCSYGHLVDERRWDELDRVFTNDVFYRGGGSAHARWTCAGPREDERRLDGGGHINGVAWAPILPEP
jgi:hypothetical protein